MIWPEDVIPLDPRDAAFRANPYPTYRFLQQHAPVYYRAETGDWILSRYDDVAELLRNEHFGQMTRDASLPEMDQNPLEHLLASGGRTMQRWLLFCNPPEHKRLRKAVQPAYTAQAIECWRSIFQSIVDELIDAALAHDEIDIVRELAHPLPLRVAATMMGVPQGDMSRLDQWVGEFWTTIELDPDLDMFLRGRLAAGRLERYFKTILVGSPPNVRANQPHPSPLDSLLHAHDGGEISEEELWAHCVLFMIGGYVPVRHLIATGIANLLSHPAQWQKLCEEPALIGTAVAELLRYDGPIHLSFRSALIDTEFAGVEFSRGQRVVILAAAAQRDPAHFMRADELDITRTPNPHLAFGRGIHYCLGLHVAQMTAEIAIGTLAQRLPGLQLATTELEWGKTALMRGLDRLPVMRTRDKARV